MKFERASTISLGSRESKKIFNEEAPRQQFSLIRLMKKVLMCPPTQYEIAYEINPWMHVEDQPNKKAAFEQWNTIYQLYLKLGIEVSLINQVNGLPDMVFTANGGVAKDKIFVSGNYRFKERKGEERYFQQWFKEHGYEVKTLKHFQGGEGDALFYKDTLYLGYGFRSDEESHKELGELFNVPIVSLKLINPYFYDFDTTFCPLGDRGVLVYPEGFDEEGKRRSNDIPGMIPLTREQANNFVCNSVYINGKLLVSFVDDDLKKKLSTLDIEPILCNVSEFKKAGGGIKCLTLYLDQY